MHCIRNDKMGRSRCAVVKLGFLRSLLDLLQKTPGGSCYIDQVSSTTVYSITHDDFNVPRIMHIVLLSTFPATSTRAAVHHARAPIDSIDTTSVKTL